MTESDLRRMCPARGNDMVRGRRTGLVWSADVILVRAESRGFPAVITLAPRLFLSAWNDLNSFDKCLSWLQLRSSLSRSVRSASPRGSSDI